MGVLRAVGPACFFVNSSTERARHLQVLDHLPSPHHNMADKKSVLASPAGIEDLWAIMGMKKFSILDDGNKADEEAPPDLGKPLLGTVSCQLSCVASDSQSVHISLRFTTQ